MFMHSRIFQVSMRPIEKADYIRENDYYEHWFTREIADYVSEDCDRDAGIEWLKECSRGYEIGKDIKGEYLIVTSKENYFKDAFERFQKAFNEISKTTFYDFVNGINLWNLNDANEDKFGFYVDADGELMTFDSFVRGCVCNEKYYIGNVLDFHY